MRYNLDRGKVVVIVGLAIVGAALNGTGVISGSAVFWVLVGLAVCISGVYISKD